MLTFSGHYKGTLQSDLNYHMSGVTKQVMNSPCVDCTTGKTVNKALNDQKGTGQRSGRGRNGYRGRGRGGFRGRGRGNRGRGRGGYNNGYNRGNSNNRNQNQSNDTTNNTGGGKGIYKYNLYDLPYFRRILL